MTFSFTARMFIKVSGICAALTIWHNAAIAANNLIDGSYETRAVHGCRDITIQDFDVEQNRMVAHWRWDDEGGGTIEIDANNDEIKTKLDGSFISASKITTQRIGQNMHLNVVATDDEMGDCEFAFVLRGVFEPDAITSSAAPLFNEGNSEITEFSGTRQCRDMSFGTLEVGKNDIFAIWRGDGGFGSIDIATMNGKMVGNLSGPMFTGSEATITMREHDLYVAFGLSHKEGACEIEFAAKGVLREKAIKPAIAQSLNAVASEDDENRRLQEQELASLKEEQRQQENTLAELALEKSRLEALDLSQKLEALNRTRAEEDNLWNSITSSDRIDDFDQYLSLYPEGRYTSEARSRKQKLLASLGEGGERELWNSVIANPTVSGLQGFVARYPHGTFAAIANTKLSALKELNQIKDVDFGNYYALVIGIDKYDELPDLNAAVHDARGVADALDARYGFRVTLLENPDRLDILDALDNLRETLGYRDNLLIYYAGHGWLDEEANRGYWLPANAKPNRRARWLSNADLTDTLRTLQSKHVMIVADSCFSGTLTRSTAIGLKSGNYWRRMAEKQARVAITSGGLEPVSDVDQSSGHSPFAKAFLNALNSNETIMDGTSLFNEIRRPVMINANQTPEYSDVRNAGHDGGDFLFIRKQ
jgi:hypothetical protein